MTITKSQILRRKLFRRCLSPDSYEINIYINAISGCMPLSREENGKGRDRYIAFRIQGPKNLKFNQLVDEFRRRSSMMNADTKFTPWLIQFRRECGIIRCLNSNRDVAMRFLRGIDSIGGVPVKVDTLSTSGTLRALRERCKL